MSQAIDDLRHDHDAIPFALRILSRMAEAWISLQRAAQRSLSADTNEHTDLAAGLE